MNFIVIKESNNKIIKLHKSVCLSKGSFSKILTNDCFITRTYCDCGDVERSLARIVSAGFNSQRGCMTSSLRIIYITVYAVKNIVIMKPVENSFRRCVKSKKENNESP